MRQARQRGHKGITCNVAIHASCIGGFKPFSRQIAAGNRQRLDRACHLFQGCRTALNVWRSMFKVVLKQQECPATWNV
eukprot:93025-Chlamydomonas_euryale.AAC.2